MTYGPGKLSRYIKAVTLQSHCIELTTEHYLSCDLQGQVALLKEFGMLVRVAPKIKALCPTMHLADVPLQNPERLFVVGMDAYEL